MEFILVIVGIVLAIGIISMILKLIGMLLTMVFAIVVLIISFIIKYIIEISALLAIYWAIDNGNMTAALIIIGVYALLKLIRFLSVSPVKRAVRKHFVKYEMADVGDISTALDGKFGFIQIQGAIDYYISKGKLETIRFSGKSAAYRWNSVTFSSESVITNEIKMD